MNMKQEEDFWTPLVSTDEVAEVTRQSTQGGMHVLINCRAAVYLSWLERLPRERSYDLDVRVPSMPTDLQKLMPALSVSVPHRCFQCRCEFSWKTLRPSDRT